MCYLRYIAGKMSQITALPTPYLIVNLVHPAIHSHKKYDRNQSSYWGSRGQ